MNRNPSPELIFAPLSFHRALLEPDSGLVLLEDKAEAGKGKALFFFFFFFFFGGTGIWTQGFMLAR
jgi:hypothetical protein